MTKKESRRRKFNPKRQIKEGCEAEWLSQLAVEVRYGGNPEHKRNPGDFGLTPPGQPKADKSLCDVVGIFKRRQALNLLRSGVKRGLVSKQMKGDFPQNIWSVTKDGCPVEAQLENPTLGTYHGYPMPSTDPFREAVLSHWNGI